MMNALFSELLNLKGCYIFFTWLILFKTTRVFLNISTRTRKLKATYLYHTKHYIKTHFKFEVTEPFSETHVFRV